MHSSEVETKLIKVEKIDNFFFYRCLKLRGLINKVFYLDQANNSTFVYNMNIQKKTV